MVFLQVWIPGPLQSSKKPESLVAGASSQGKCSGFRSSLGPLAREGPGLSGKFCTAGLGLRQGKGCLSFWEACVVPRGLRGLGAGGKGHSTLSQTQPHFPGKLPFWPRLLQLLRRSGGISCRLMPWLLALWGKGE